MVDSVGVREFTATGSIPVATKQYNDVHYPLYATGVTSIVNSTTTALNDGQTFTGDWEDVEQFNNVVVAVKADQDGDYAVEFSPDGINTDASLIRYYRAAKINPPQKFTITRRYCRVTFTNSSGSNQTFMRLQTTFGDKADLNIPVDSILAKNYDSISVRPTEYATEVALGRREGATSWEKWGYNTDVDTGAEETVWTQGGRLVPLTSPSTFTITYDGTGGGSTDGAGTTGARKLGFYYVDDNRIAQYTEHTLGTDGSDVTSFSGLGINRVKVVEAGSARVNNSVIVVTATTGGNPQAHIPDGDGITQQAFYFTQASSKGLLDWVHINVVKIAVGTLPVVTIRGWEKDYIRNVDHEIFRETVDVAVDNNLNLHPPRGLVIGGSSMLEFTAETDIDNTDVSLRFGFNEVEDVDN